VMTPRISSDIKDFLIKPLPENGGIL
jgi:hypothetical protein